MDKRLAYAAVAAITLAAAPALAQTPGSAGAIEAAAQLPPTTAAPGKGALPPAPSVGATPPAANPSTQVTPPAAGSETSATGAASAAASGSDVSVTTGMDVKDSTGATIGKITEVKAGADGKKTATIKMGADVFAVDASSLAVAGGAATVNASQSEIKTMLGRKK